MLVIFGGVLLTTRMASSVAGDKVGSVWPTLVFVLVFMVLTMCTAAAVVSGILHSLRRSGVHRLENVRGRMYSVVSNGNQ